MGGMSSTAKRHDDGNSHPGKSAAGPTTTNPTASPSPVSREFEADRPQIMPVYNSPSQLESAKRKRQALMARSGRSSTNLTGNPGTRSYQSSFLGSVT